MARFALTAPTNLTATAVSSARIDLSWTDLSSFETHYRIERSPDGSSGWSEIGAVAAGVTSYQSTGLAGSTAYYYRVRASSALLGNTIYSGYSNTANATTSANNAPAFGSDPFSASNATEDAAYSASIAGSATDSDAGDTITYSKVTGPEWLSVAVSSTLLGNTVYSG